MLLFNSISKRIGIIPCLIIYPTLLVQHPQPTWPFTANEPPEDPPAPPCRCATPGRRSVGAHWPQGASMSGRGGGDPKRSNKNRNDRWRSSRDLCIIWENLGKSWNFGNYFFWSFDFRSRHTLIVCSIPGETRGTTCSLSCCKQQLSNTYKHT